MTSSFLTVFTTFEKFFCLIEGPKKVVFKVLGSQLTADHVILASVELLGVD
jgi:hypothetical protein